MVVGVTSEPGSMVERHVEKKQMEFPIAIVDKSEEAAFGIKGFPTSVLLDVDGTVLWRGHPGRFKKEFTRERLEQALTRTGALPPLPQKHASSVDKYVKDRAFGRAYAAAARSLSRAPDSPELKLFTETIEGMLRSRMEAASKAKAKGDYGRAFGLFEAIVDGFDKVPGAEEAQTALADLKKDKEAKDDLAAARKWNSAMDQWRDGDFEKALKAASKIASKYRHTPTGERAIALLSRHGG